MRVLFTRDLGFGWTTIEEQSEGDDPESAEEEDNCSTDDNISSATVEEVKSDITEIQATVGSNYSTQQAVDSEGREKVETSPDDISTWPDVDFPDTARSGDSEEVSPTNDKQDKDSIKTNEDVSLVDNLDPKLILQMSSPPLPRKSVQTPNKIIFYHSRNQPKTHAMTIETSRFTAMVIHDREQHNPSELRLTKGDFVFVCEGLTRSMSQVQSFAKSSGVNKKPK